MPNTFESIVLLCGLAGIVMVLGSMLLLYNGVIKLSEKVAGSQIEAEFKNQLKVNVRNPALGLFFMGFMFFALALWIVRPAEVAPIEFRGEITGADVDSLTVRIKVADWPVNVASDGKIIETVRPSLYDKLYVEILAPGYSPAKWRASLEAEDIRKGRVRLKPPAFSQIQKRPAPDPNNITAPQLNAPDKSQTIIW